MWMKILIFGSITLNLVECGCNYQSLLQSRTDFEPLCWEWWDMANKDEYKDSDRGKCVNLIEEKCPHMINVERYKITRSYYRGKYEEWSQKVKAILKSNTDKPMTYYTGDNFHVCWDERGIVTDCEYWWSVAKRDIIKNKYKERCINRILNHCSSMIKQVSEISASKVQRFGKGYDVKTVTYKRVDGKEGDTAFFNRYVPA